ncbi:hypothetical protein DPMN_021331 [Dreissena polymorpha]|uniref:Uncharacterized protein n=1 Tax=Dreissena polymorpha TaxID=45954 RepID=A0A9D4NMN6_DREPO|nr:hypothetical protein DPMN_021331 [Dreissena polymorpha]
MTRRKLHQSRNSHAAGTGTESVQLGCSDIASDAHISKRMHRNAANSLGRVKSYNNAHNNIIGHMFCQIHKNACVLSVNNSNVDHELWLQKKYDHRNPP